MNDLVPLDAVCYILFQIVYVISAVGNQKYCCFDGISDLNNPISVILFKIDTKMNLSFSNDISFDLEP